MWRLYPLTFKESDNSRDLNAEERIILKKCLKEIRCQGVDWSNVVQKMI
jgi:hypothetical protein